jgi:K+/H+ antiporter YhaU regulatory subunit KhtT
VNVPTESLLDGRTLGELRIRTTTGASIVGIIRGSSLVATLDGNARLQKGDLLAELGTRDQIARFQQAMRAYMPALP